MKQMRVNVCFRVGGWLAFVVSLLVSRLEISLSCLKAQ